MDQYAVIGNPIEHSKSPQIHAAFARQTGQRMAYVRLLGERDQFGQKVRDFFAQGGRGMNVTLPFKEAAWRMVDERSARAQTAGAVNTLILLPDGRLRGENTDGIGLVRDLCDNQGAALQGKRILLLGAGGAARGALQPLLEAGSSQVTVANRTAFKAEKLASDLAQLGHLTGCGLDRLEGQHFDLVINATAAGLAGDVPDIPNAILAENGWCYDMMYADKPTAFMRWGLAHGAANSLDGLGMLVEQAAESFCLWRGVRPDTGPVIESLRRGILH